MKRATGEERGGVAGTLGGMRRDQRSDWSLGPCEEGDGGLGGIEKQDRRVGEDSSAVWTDQGRDTK